MSQDYHLPQITALTTSMAIASYNVNASCPSFSLPWLASTMAPTFLASLVPSMQQLSKEKITSVFPHASIGGLLIELNRLGMTPYSLQKIQKIVHDVGAWTTQKAIFLLSTHYFIDHIHFRGSPLGSQTEKITFYILFSELLGSHFNPAHEFNSLES